MPNGHKPQLPSTLQLCPASFASAAHDDPKYKNDHACPESDPQSLVKLSQPCPSPYIHLCLLLILPPSPFPVVFSQASLTAPQTYTSSRRCTVSNGSVASNPMQLLAHSTMPHLVPLFSYHLCTQCPSPQPD